MNRKLPHPRLGLDYAWSHVSVDGHKAVGSTFAARYLSHDPGKNLTAGEAHELQAAGIDVVVVWESTATRAIEGQDAGAQDARAALGLAVACGMPARRPIYFAVDFDPAGNAGGTDAYFDGVASVLSRPLCGPYGGIEVCAHQLDRGFGYAWQTYAWSGGRLDPRVQLYQYSNGHTVAGASCDYDHAIYEDFGQWSYRQVPADPHHYHRFAKGPFKLDGRDILERATVERYDRLIEHPVRNAIKIRRTRRDLVLLRKRVWAVAHEGQGIGQGDWGTPPPTWGLYHRGWRWRELAHRTKLRKAS